MRRGRKTVRASRFKSSTPVTNSETSRPIESYQDMLARMWKEERERADRIMVTIDNMILRLRAEVAALQSLSDDFRSSKPL